MSELNVVSKAIEIDNKQPHLNNYEIVLELSKIQDHIDDLESKESMDNSLDIQALKDSITALENGLIDGLTKQVNYLQDKVKELENKCACSNAPVNSENKDVPLISQELSEQ